MFFDTHIHLQDMPEMTPEALAASGVRRCICVSAKETDWSEVCQWANSASDMVVPAFAVHPWYVDDVSAQWAQKLEQLLLSYPQALIGECGLDRLKNQDIELQKQVFDTQIGLSKKYGRTLLIHAVKSWGILDNYWKHMPSKFVFHSFNGRIEQVKQILNFGGYLSVNASFLRNKDAEKILKYIPLSRLLIETDAPYQSLVTDLENLCCFIAQTRQEKLEVVEAALYNNAQEVVKTW